MTQTPILLTALASAVCASLLTLAGQHFLVADDPEPVSAAAAPDTATLPPAEAESLRTLHTTVDRIAARLDELEASQRSVVPAANTAPTEARPAEASTMKAAVPTKQFRSLMKKVLRSSMANTATEDEQAMFWAAARQGDHLKTLITDLEKQIEAHPTDTELHMDLADAYVAQLLTVPSGPERGVWGMKAERQWSETLKIDPNHWDAQYSIAYSHSMYPDFLDKTDDAIQGFERALEIQRGKPHDPRHAQTYAGLVRMYKKKGRTEDALKIAREAVQLYPKNASLATTLTELEAEAKKRK